MSLPAHARRAIAALAAALALGIAACDDEDVERGVEEGATESEQAGRDAKEAGEEAAREAEKTADEAKRELDK
jgi:hypothetical protein